MWPSRNHACPSPQWMACRIQLNCRPGRNPVTWFLLPRESLRDIPIHAPGDRPANLHKTADLEWLSYSALSPPSCGPEACIPSKKPTWIYAHPWSQRHTHQPWWVSLGILKIPNDSNVAPLSYTSSQLWSKSNPADPALLILLTLLTLLGDNTHQCPWWHTWQPLFICE